MPHVLALLFAFALMPTPSPTISPLPSRIVQWYALRGAEASGLDPSLVRAVIDAESGGDPHAVSKAGAVGMMQLEPGTASDCGIHDRFNPLANVKCGSKTLAYLVRRYGIEEGLASYNYGAGNVGSTGGHFSALPQETQGYVKSIILEYDALQHLELVAQAPTIPVRACGRVAACENVSVEDAADTLLFPLDWNSPTECLPQDLAYGFAGPSIALGDPMRGAPSTASGLATVGTSPDVSSITD